MDVLLIVFQLFKIKKCVTFRFMNTEMYSQIYVASYQRKYFWRILWIKRYSLNLHTNTQVLHKHDYEFKQLYAKCLNNKILTIFHSRYSFSYSTMWLSKIHFKYLQKGHNSNFGDVFKLSEKKNDIHLL